MTLARTEIGGESKHEQVGGESEYKKVGGENEHKKVGGLSWPPPKRSRGRPSLQQLCQDALYKHIHNGDLPVGVIGEMPIWWAPGKPVVLDDNVLLCEVAQTGASSSTKVGTQNLEAQVADLSLWLPCSCTSVGLGCFSKRALAFRAIPWRCHLALKA
eukprot:5807696-Amphidinium_carterae.1